jgi:ribonuclease D
MGRWKRKKEYYKKKPRKNGASTETTNVENLSDEGKPFSPIQLDRVREYLREYRDGCHVMDRGGYFSSKVKENLDVGGLCFVALTDDVLTSPFLRLPKGLSPKRRRTIHQLCVDLDLFHESVGSDREGRILVVSIYRDGFLNVPNFKPPPPVIPLSSCRPWFCRKQPMLMPTVSSGDVTPPSSNNIQSVKLLTQVGREKIEALIDQPGECIRDDIDVIDYVALDRKDLSNIPLPSYSDSEQEWMIVDSAIKMKQCANELEKAQPTELAFDLEFYNPSRYLQVTCLLQISANGKDYVIDTLADGVWENVPLLRPLFVDASIVKIGHAISGDVKSLHRDFGIFVVNAFDTFEAAKALRLKSAGLASVCGDYGLVNSREYANLKAVYQSTDWRLRPLTEPMIRYGRYDVHFLVALRQLMMRDLTRNDLWDNFRSSSQSKMVVQALTDTLRSIAIAEGDVDEYNDANDDLIATETEIPHPNLSDDESDEDNGYFTPPEEVINGQPERKARVGAKELRMQPELMTVISHSQQRCLELWTVKAESLSKNTQYAELMKQAQAGRLKWTASHSALLDKLIEWRADVANKEECLPGMVCSLDFLVTVAAKRPASEVALRRIKYYLTDLLQYPLHHDGLISIVKKSLEEDGESVVDCIPSYGESAAKTRRSKSVMKTWAAVTLAGGVIVGALVLLRSRRRR